MERYSREFLSETLESFGLLDPEDAYQVYVLYALIDCTCTICGRTKHFDKLCEGIPTSEWIRTTADSIRGAGWVMPRVVNDTYDLNPICLGCTLEGFKPINPS